jgi:hypothetical protein
VQDASCQALQSRFVSGHDFSRAELVAKMVWASTPATTTLSGA